MMIVGECSGEPDEGWKWYWMPWFYKGPGTIRIGWGWFAVALIRGGLYELTTEARGWSSAVWPR